MKNFIVLMILDSDTTGLNKHATWLGTSLTTHWKICYGSLRFIRRECEK